MRRILLPINCLSEKQISYTVPLRPPKGEFGYLPALLQGAIGWPAAWGPAASGRKADLS